MTRSRLCMARWRSRHADPKNVAPGASEATSCRQSRLGFHDLKILLLTQIGWFGNPGKDHLRAAGRRSAALLGFYQDFKKILLGFY